MPSALGLLGMTPCSLELHGWTGCFLLERTVYIYQFEAALLKGKFHTRRLHTKSKLSAIFGRELFVHRKRPVGL